MDTLCTQILTPTRFLGEEVADRLGKVVMNQDQLLVPESKERPKG
jgi:hypothetical protein